jgi:hypothetical protein
VSVRLLVSFVVRSDKVGSGYLFGRTQYTQ